MEGRMEPRDIEAEYGILSSMLVDERASSSAFEQLNEEDFFDKNNRLIFSSMLGLEAEGSAIDLITVSAKLKQLGMLEDVGGYEFISELSAKSGLTGNIQYYLNIVKRTSVLRKLIKFSNDLARRAYIGEDDPRELLDKAESELYEIAEGKDTNAPSPLDRVLIGAFEILESRAAMRGKLVGLTTGYEDLNFYLKGLQKKDLIIVAARPAMGKTAFAVNMAVNAARYAKARCVIFSLEMSKEQLSQRMLSFTGYIEMEKLSSGRIEDNDWSLLLQASEDLGSTKLFIDDTPAITLSSLKAKCRSLMLSGGLDLVVIDYLQLMDSDGRVENRQQEISKISRGLKSLAKEIDCPVVALSQLSRAPDARADKKPVLSDLRESGAIEQDADIVMLLYRDDYYHPESEEKGITEVIIAKHRNGPVGSVKLLYKPEFTKFVSLDMGFQNGEFQS